MAEKTLNDMTCELDSTLNSIGEMITTLADVKILFGQLIDKIGTAINGGEVHINLHEHRRMVRVLFELMHYTVEDLSNNYEKVMDINQFLFLEVRKTKHDGIKKAADIAVSAAAK